ncbi:putative RND efflux membrane fusion protein [Candidatus Rhodobacter oscarellae]|uniref:Putative RND efflux membrane fusion protein n=1 Tax=Candidatus Rhodobacter oscarellae TaxID=1675527 RepID=A0A0J9EA00_9RHOB|nr:HlyD family efflux transporter periplasmic adaptor subunit [Candidatus Rhodobacter lobularis]KMW59471.1 putative RND efflux membrane fusion protein [Candidatus Rhodobacter lobularis]
MTPRLPLTALALALVPFTAGADDAETYFGTVRASEIDGLSFEARGCIVEISDAAKTARRAAGGQVLVRLDAQRAELAVVTAEARLAELAAQVEERELSLAAARADDLRRQEERDFVEEEFQRNSVMLGRGLINETTMDGIERRFMDARFTAERAKEAISTAEAALKRAQIALEIGTLDMQSAQIDLSKYTLSAPYDGVLVGFEASVGDCVQDGALAARIYKPDQKSVDVFLPIRRLAAPEASALSIGGAVTVERVTGETCGGAITRIDTEADTETQFVEATVEIDPACAPGIFLNEAVEVQPVETAEDA